MYSLRFRNMHTGEPDKTINANTTFSALEKAKAYGLGSRYVTQDDGKIVSVRDPSQDPIVEPLYSQEYVSALQHESAVNWEAATSLVAENEELKRANRAQGDHINQQQDRIDSLEKKNADFGRALRAAEKRIAELEHDMNLTEMSRDIAVSQMKESESREKELRAKLATPVRLKKVDSSNVPFAGDGFNAAVDYCADRVRAAGFTVEGDE
ncbi:hypothetical protein SAMN06272783_2754 [Serratia sp. JKS296]|nr:hypothetical protein SAMN06272783_2754 [Serratia sp. JKS296]